MSRSVLVLGFSMLSAVFFIAQSGVRIKIVVQQPAYHGPNEAMVEDVTATDTNRYLERQMAGETNRLGGKSASPLSTGEQTDGEEENLIPKKLHFVFLSPKFPDEQDPVPEHYMFNMKGWQELHPDYSVTLWTNKMMKAEFPHLPKLLENVTAMAMASDLLRYHAIRKHGGIYLDMDIAPVKNMDILRTKFSPVFSDCEDHGRRGNYAKPPNGIEEYAMTNKKFKTAKNTCRQVNNNVIGSVPNHPVLDMVIEQAMEKSIEDIEKYRNPPYKLSRTGPHRWTRCIWANPDVNILHKQLFHPCNFFARDSCNPARYKSDPHVFGMHEWKGSWKHGGKGLDNTRAELIGVGAEKKAGEER